MSDPLLPLLLLLRYMHILGAIMLMGGTIFMRFALAPSAAGLDAATRAALHEQVRSRWAKFVMLAAGLLLISGIANLALAGRYAFKDVFGMSYHMVVGIKLLLSLPIFLIASLLVGRSAAGQKVRSQAITWMNVNLALALVMVLIGGALKFVVRQPVVRQPKAAGPAAAVAPLDTLADKTLPFRAARK